MEFCAHYWNTPQPSLAHPRLPHMHWTWTSHDLQFKLAAGTSRGVLRTKRSYFLIAEHEGYTYYGECGLLEGLSPDGSGYEARLDRVCAEMGAGTEGLEGYPSIRFGVEMLERAIAESGECFFDTLWSAGQKKMDINGLIWMGDYRFMRDQIEQKLKEGWNCIKLKIGAIDHAEELRLLRRIRDEFNADTIEIRVDANGAYAPEEAYDILQRLHELSIHSIEQPIKAGSWEAMADLIRRVDISVALDEELIGIYGDRKAQLVQTIQPDYLILKPSLLGGWAASAEWIALTTSIERSRNDGQENMGYWVTSALESNIGLNAIAQWVATLDVTIPQGLGTGLLYEENIIAPLVTTPGYLSYDPMQSWNYSLISPR